MLLESFPGREFSKISGKCSQQYIYIWDSGSLVDLTGIRPCAILLGDLIAVVAGEISHFFKKWWGSVFSAQILIKRQT